jgi:hypothetical protein
MNRVKWYLKQLLPLTYRTEFVENGRRKVAVWNMWLGRCYNIDEWIVE